MASSPEPDEKKVAKRQSIRQQLHALVVERIPVPNLCDLVMSFVTHATVRACSLLQQPFKILHAETINTAQTIDGAAFYSLAGAVGCDVLNLHLHKSEKHYCLPLVGGVPGPLELSISVATLTVETKESTIDTFEVRIQNKKETSVARLASLRIRPSPSVSIKKPRVSVSDDNRMVSIASSSAYGTDGAEDTLLFEQWLPGCKPKRFRPVVFRKAQAFELYEVELDWLHGNRHAAYQVSESSCVAFKVPEEVEDGGSVYGHESKAPALCYDLHTIRSMNSRAMRDSWQHKKKHSFPALFTSWARVQQMNPARNLLLVAMDHDWWFIRYEAEHWWIVHHMELSGNLRMEWSVSGSHFFVLDYWREKSVCVMFGDDREVQTTEHVGTINNSVESCPERELKILRELQIRSEAVPFVTSVTATGPFFIVELEREILFICRETGDIIQRFKFDERILNCVWNLSKTRLYVLLSCRLLTLGNDDFETLLHTTYRDYPVMTSLGYEQRQKKGHQSLSFQLLGFRL